MYLLSGIEVLDKHALYTLHHNYKYIQDFAQKITCTLHITKVKNVFYFYMITKTFLPCRAHGL